MRTFSLSAIFPESSDDIFLLPLMNAETIYSGKKDPPDYTFHRTSFPTIDAGGGPHSPTKRALGSGGAYRDAFSSQLP